MKITGESQDPLPLTTLIKMILMTPRLIKTITVEKEDWQSTLVTIMNCGMISKMMKRFTKSGQALTSPWPTFDHFRSKFI